MKEIDIWAGLYIIPLVALFIALPTFVLVLVIYMAVKGGISQLNQVIKSAESITESNNRLRENFEARLHIIDTALRDLCHDHKDFHRALDEYTRTFDRMERKLISIKDNQSTFLKNQNENAASGNKVKVYSDQKPSEGQQTVLLNAIIDQLIDKLQKNT